MAEKLKANFNRIFFKSNKSKIPKSHASIVLALTPTYNTFTHLYFAI